VDDRRRQAEREAARDPAAASRLLLERVRSGELDEERLRLAAWLGDPAAAAACRVDPPDDLAGWVVAVADWGQQAFVRLQVAALRAACRVHADVTSRAAAEVLVDALDAWTQDPSPQTRGPVLTLMETQLAPNVGQTLAQRRNPSDWVIVGAAQVASRSVGQSWVACAVVPTLLAADTDPARLEGITGHFADQGAIVTWRPTGERLELVVHDCGRIGSSGITKAMMPLVDGDPLELMARLRPVRERASPMVYAARVAGDAEVRQAIREALVPWALASGPGT
jgi:hypothetical protein